MKNKILTITALLAMTFMACWNNSNATTKQSLDLESCTINPTFFEENLAYCQQLMKKRQDFFQDKLIYERKIREATQSGLQCQDITADVWIQCATRNGQNQNQNATCQKMEQMCPNACLCKRLRPTDIKTCGSDNQPENKRDWSACQRIMECEKGMGTAADCKEGGRYSL